MKKKISRDPRFTIHPRENLFRGNPCKVYYNELPTGVQFEPSEETGYIGEARSFAAKGNFLIDAYISLQGKAGRIASSETYFCDLRWSAKVDAIKGLRKAIEKMILGNPRAIKALVCSVQPYYGPNCQWDCGDQSYAKTKERLAKELAETDRPFLIPWPE
jgi:hypothetical protein